MQEFQCMKEKGKNCDPWFLRWHYIKKYNLSIADVKTRESMYFGKPLSDSTIWSWICKCKILHWKKKSLILTLCRNSIHISGLRSICDGPSRRREDMVVRWISIPDLFWKVWVLCALSKRWKIDHLDIFYQNVQKPDSVKVSGCISVNGTVHFHLCDGSINTDKYNKGVRETDSDLFLPRWSKIVLHTIETWLSKEKIWGLDWTSYHPDLLDLEKVKENMRRLHT